MDALARLRPAAKVGVVVGGYVLAFIAATVAVWIQVATATAPASTTTVDPQASAGMGAFGDVLLFLAVFVLASIPPTAAAALFLARWWRRAR
jgi:hypothetical protein